MSKVSYSWVVFFTILAVPAIVSAQGQQARKNRDVKNQVPTVVFVCEHGAAKSVVSAAHFNRLAKEKNLKLRAVPRGTNPDKEMPVNTINALKADGLDVGITKPRKLTRPDVVGAVRVVTFYRLPEAFANVTPVEQWDDVPPMSEDYNKFRDIVVERIKRLLAELESAR